MSFPYRRCWAEVDLNAIVENCHLCHRAAETMAVVKADAYGHGDVPVSQALQTRLGIRNFAVSNLDEAIRLRTHGIQGQILILGYTPIQNFPELLEHDITQAILDEDYAARAAATGLRVKAHFALDTGMNRIGLDADSPEACAACIRSHLNDFQVTGFFTHLCVADAPQSAEARDFTAQQIAKFRKVRQLLEDLHLPYPHCLNSAGTLWHGCPESALERLGIVLYGLKPDYANTLPAGVRPALQWKTVISQIKEVRPGETVGYGRTFAPDATRRIATLPVGYADGYHRLLSNRGKVLLHGKAAPIVGRVCMDQIMVDVTEIPQAKPEDEVILLGKSGSLQYTADDMAQTIGTIGYEIVCDISKRVPRVYSGGQASCLS